MRAVALLLLATTAGCAQRTAPPAAEPARVMAAVAPEPWRGAITPADRNRLRDWRDTWLAALADARNHGFAGRIATLGTLADPDHHLADPAPPPGDYRCRVIKLGSRGAAGLRYVAYPWFACTVGSGASPALIKRSGSQRYNGRIHPRADGRSTFIGTLALGDEAGVIPYGRDAARDVVGLVDRIGERRWRLAMPRPAFESLLDLMELEPAR